MANSDEPRREKPRDLYPEWTSRTHRVKPYGRLGTLERPGEGRASFHGPVMKRQWAALLLSVFVIAVGAAGYFLYAEKRRVETPRIEGTTRSFDDPLEREARLRVEREPGLEKLGLTITVRDQVATVSGAVPDEATRERVLNIVRMTPDLRGVVDELQIKK